MKGAAKTTRGANPQVRRLRNLARHWEARFNACVDERGVQDTAALLRATYDRARAAAARAQRTGSQPHALHELAEVLNTWAERAERAEVDHANRTAGPHSA